MQRHTVLRIIGWTLLASATATLSLLTWEWRVSGTPATAAVLLAAGLVTVSLVWPFLLGWRPPEPVARRSGHLGAAVCCTDCGTSRRIGASLDFCLRCGGTRTDASTAY